MVRFPVLAISAPPSVYTGENDNDKGDVPDLLPDHLPADDAADWLRDFQDLLQRRFATGIMDSRYSCTHSMSSVIFVNALNYLLPQGRTMYPRFGGRGGGYGHS